MAALRVSRSNMASRRRKNTELLQREIENCRRLVEKAKEGLVEDVRTILKCGVSVDADEYNRALFYKSKNYMTPLLCAASRGHDECVQELIASGADLDARDMFDMTAVHLAAENGHVDSLHLLLDAGASCNVATKYSRPGLYTAVTHVGGTTPLQLATSNNHIDCIRELILNGADYNAVDETGRTSLYIAASLGYEDAVLTHLRNAIGRDILSLPIRETGDTPLHECVRHNMLHCIGELLEHGSDVNHRNHQGWSPLHLAVHNTRSFSVDVIQALVTRGYNTDVNQLDGTGKSPLQYVSFFDNCKQNRRPLVASFLIAYGAQFMDLKNKHGCTLLQQELQHISQDMTILKAIVRTCPHLPSLDSLDINYTHNANQPAPPSGSVTKCQWYKTLTRSPRTLQHYCRCVVRDTLGVHRLKHTHKLPLPVTLQNYLLLKFSSCH